MEEKKKTNKKFIIIVATLVLIGVVFGVFKYLHSLAHEETDDAQIQANMNPIIPRVGGFIKKIYVTDNQQVKKGDTLFVIDNRDYLVQVQLADAQLAAAQSGVAVSQSSIGSFQANISTVSAQVLSAGGNIETAKTKLWRANNDFERYQNLYKNHSITAQQYEQALAAKQEAEQQVSILESQQKAIQSQRNAAEKQTTTSEKQVSVAEANVLSAKAQLEVAQLNVDYSFVTSPIDGQLSNVPLQVGQYVQPGQSLFYIVDTSDIWVVANFKETQLRKMDIGQKVSITTDAYPHLEFEAVIQAFSPATGSRFSLLPPDNATGNFVKTIQRLPVKIDFTKNNDSVNLQKLRSGMNVLVDVHIK